MVTEEVLNVALISYHRTRPHEGAVVAMRAALAVVAPIIAAQERERVKKLVANECEDLMQRTKTPIQRAREDGHLSEECHQEGRWHGVNDLLEYVEEVGPAAIRALGDAT